MVARSRAVTQDDAEDARQAVDDRFFEFVTYYSENAIWLGRELCNKINAVLGRLNVLRVWGERVSTHPELVDMILELEDEIGRLRQPVEKEFRRLLAVEPAPNPD